MGIITYALAVLSNMAAILVLPVEHAPRFLKAYSLGSMICGVLIIYAFSRSELGPNLQRMRLWLVLILFITTSISAIGGWVPLQAITYAAAILLSDYYITQCGTARHVKAYRWLLILSVVPALLGDAFTREWMVPLRSLVMMLCIVSLSVGGRHPAPLNLTSPLIYIITTHAIHFGSLMIISSLLSGSMLRIWYVGAQIGQGLVLKVMDFRIRRGAEVKPRILWLLYVLSGLIGASLGNMYWQLWPTMTYFMAIISLIYVARIAILK